MTNILFLRNMAYEERVRSFPYFSRTVYTYNRMPSLRNLASFQREIVSNHIEEGSNDNDLQLPTTEIAGTSQVDSSNDIQNKIQEFMKDNQFSERFSELNVNNPEYLIEFMTAIERYVKNQNIENPKLVNEQMLFNAIAFANKLYDTIHASQEAGEQSMGSVVEQEIIYLIAGEELTETIRNVLNPKNIEGFRILMKEAKDLVDEIDKVSQRLSKHLTGVPGVIQEIDILLKELSDTPIERQEELLKEINKKIVEFLQLFERVIGSRGFQQISPKLRGWLYDLYEKFIGEIEEKQSRYNRGGRRHGRPHWRFSEQIKQLIQSIHNAIKNDPEGMSYMSGYRADFALIMSLPAIKEHAVYSQYTLKEVVTRVIELSSKVAEYIREKNAKIEAEELLSEKRQELADLEIFNLPSTIRNLIASMLGIDAKYLDPAVLREMAARAQLGDLTAA